MYSKSNMPEQSKKLLTMLSYVITKFNKPEDITGEEKNILNGTGATIHSRTLYNCR